VGNIPLTVNGAPVSGREGMTILEVAQENAIDIPTLCYTPGLSPIGACRICVVEVEGFRTLVGSCYTPVTEGMVVYTHSPKVLKARKILLELMMASHPDSCLVCDEANLCKLRKLCTELEVGLPRFRIRKHYYPVEDENPYIVRDLSKCILCRRCVTICENKNGKKLFSVAYRGFSCKIIHGADLPLGSDACQDCDECIAGCPTGSLSKPRKIGEKKQGTVLVIKG
jgi:NADH dehydrogenase/NADH:ubiquinone oxidoreductase subunit G